MIIINQVEVKKEKIFRKFREIIGSDGSRSRFDESIRFQELDQVFSFFRVWVVGFWVVFFLGFLVLMVAVFFRGKKRKIKSKYYKSKKRLFYFGLFDLNGRNVEMFDKI